MERRKPSITIRKLTYRLKPRVRSPLPVTRTDLITKSHEVEEASREFVHFIRSKIVCPPKWRASLAMLLFQTLLALMVALGSPFDSPTSSSSTNNSQQVFLNAGTAIAEFLPTLIWTAMFMMNFLYLTILIWPLPLGVPFIVILQFGPVYYVSVLASTLSPFHIVCGSYTVHGIIFVIVGSLAFALLFKVLFLLLLFASWIYVRGERETN